MSLCKIHISIFFIGKAHNFDKYDTNMVSNLGLPYEYTSCMHYGSNAFSKNGQPTIVALKVRRYIIYAMHPEFGGKRGTELNGINEIGVS